MTGGTSTVPSGASPSVMTGVSTSMAGTSSCTGTAPEGRADGGPDGPGSVSRAGVRRRASRAAVGVAAEGPPQPVSSAVAAAPTRARRVRGLMLRWSADA
ncbi:hypothetical protein GCM10020256_19660 [Streptomyces thermocoprophilus]